MSMRIIAIVLFLNYRQILLQLLLYLDSVDDRFLLKVVEIVSG